MKRGIKYDYLLGLFIVFSFSAYAICNIGECDRVYRVSVMLPIVYICGYLLLGILCRKRIILIKKMIMLLMGIKMVLIPNLVIINGGLQIAGFSNNIYKYTFEAVLLQIMEYSVVIIFLGFTSWKNDSLVSYTLGEENNTDKISSKRIWTALWLCIILVVGCIIIYPAFLNRLRPIFFINETSKILWMKKADMALNSIPSYIYYPVNWLFVETRLALAYMLVIKIKNSKIHFSDRVKLFFSIISIVVILVLIVPDDVATSIYAAITLFILLYLIYPQKRSEIVILLVIVCVMVLTGAFIIMPIVEGKAVSLSYFATKLNIYFSGYINTSTAVVMDELKSSKFKVLLGDFFRSFPIFRGLFTDMTTTTELFNQALGYDVIYNSQIIPLEGQGYYYLSYFGTIIFTLLHMKVLKNFYLKMVSMRSSFSFFIYGVLTMLMSFGLVMYGLFLNFSLILNHVPLLLINYLFLRRITNENFDLS